MNCSPENHHKLLAVTMKNFKESFRSNCAITNKTTSIDFLFSIEHLCCFAANKANLSNAAIIKIITNKWKPMGNEIEIKKKGDLVMFEIF